MKNLLSTPYLLALALTTLAGAGCDEATPGEDFGDVTDRCAGCTVKFNTFAWGYEDGGALDRLGKVWSNARLVSVELPCTKNPKDAWRYPKVCKEKVDFFKLDETWADTGELIGVRDGLKFAGADFLGSRWTIDVYEGNQVKHTNVQYIKAYEYDPLQKPHPLHYYTFMFFGDGSNGGDKGVWTPACKEDTDPISGMPVGSKALVYDDIAVDTTTGVIGKRQDSLYLACISAAVGKAGNWGFPEWEIGDVDFTAAVRTVRADYCGDGQSWTKKGNPLQVADVWGYSGFVNPAAKTEAVWDHQGALCLGTPRWTTQFSYKDVTCNGELIKPCDNATLAGFAPAPMWSKLP